MAYIAQSDLKGLIPDEYLDEALDDASPSGADSALWDAVYAAVEDEIDGRLAASYSVPIPAPIPDVLKAAAKVLACHLLYQRRGIAAEQNPWSKDADYWRKRLDAIGKGEAPLTYQIAKPAEQATLIEEESKTHSAGGHLMV
jgi:phage gp36-like protein